MSDNVQHALAEIRAVEAGERDKRAAERMAREVTRYHVFADSPTRTIHLDHPAYRCNDAYCPLAESEHVYVLTPYAYQQLRGQP